LPTTKKTAAPPKPAAKAKPVKKTPAAKKGAAPKAKPKPPPAPKPAPKKAAAPAKPAKPAPKPKAEPKPKPAKVAAAPEAKKPAAKPKAEAKPAAPVKPAKPEKPVKAPKPPKLAPVEAAFAKPKPPKPLAVAAGRAQPVTRALASPPPKLAPKPLSAPKPAPEPEIVGELHDVPAFKSKSTSKGMVLVGAVAGAFGVKGEVRLRAFTDSKAGVISYGPLYGEDGKIMLKPKSWRELKDGVAVIAPEVKTREQAEKLRGKRLFVPRANLPATAEDEFYIVDLLGSRAEALDGTPLGDIVAVWNFGAGDILEYRPPNGGPNVRITFTRETVPHVDLPGKRVVLDPPAPEPVGK
jgi:16S rRNA processing protein RimM